MMDFGSFLFLQCFCLGLVPWYQNSSRITVCVEKYSTPPLFMKDFVYYYYLLNMLINFLTEIIRANFFLWEDFKL